MSMTNHFSSRLTHFAATLLAATVMAGSACASDSQYASAGDSPCSTTPVGEMHVRVVGDQAFVPLTVNHTSLNLLVDTGDFVTALTPQASERLALPASDHAGLQMTGIGGGYNAPVVEAASVQYLSHTINNLPFAVLPDGEFSPEDHADGLFGANFMSAYGVEMDFKGGHMRFYHEASGCLAAPSWTAHATRLQATNAGHELLLIPIEINGVELNALIDTGSEDTSITRSAAIALGVTAAVTRNDEDITEQGLGSSSARLHHFDSITIGSTTFAKPLLAVDDGPSPLQSQMMTATLEGLPVAHRGVDVILGANFLFKKKIFLDYRDHAVFVE